VAVNASKKSSNSSSKGGEPQTMEELLSAYGGKFSGLSVGSKVKGVVTEKSSGRLVVDIGAKSEGLVAERAYKEAEDYIKTLSVGDEIEGTVLVSETPDGYTILSLRRSAENATWKKLEAAKNNLTPLEVEIIGTASSGFTVTFNGLNGFIPASQLGRDISKNPQSLIGKKVHAAVIDFDRESNKIVLSEKEISEKDELEKVRGVMKDLKEGDVFDGIVTTIYDFGCFVKIEIPKGKENIPVEGLVHVSELEWNKVDSPAEVVSEGEKVKVKLIGRRNGKLAFSIKQTQVDPWQEISEKYKKDEKAKGKVVKVSDFGVFVSLEPGVEGLVHITKIPPDKKLHVGDEVNVYIEDIDKEGKKLSLGLILTEKPVGYK
jgi:4-hydroxy-3-methylbut-2-enyl diphosphate reductase